MILDKNFGNVLVCVATAPRASESDLGITSDAMTLTTSMDIDTVPAVLSKAPKKGAENGDKAIAKEALLCDSAVTPTSSDCSSSSSCISSA